MERKEIERRITQLVMDFLGTSEEETTLTASFGDDLGADSFDYIELAMAVEEEFLMEIPDDDLENMKNIKAIADYVEKNGKW